MFLTAAEARSHAHLHLTTTNAVSVMAEASRLRVLVNDVPVSDTPIASPTAEDPGVLDIDLPPSLLEPGFNAVRLEVQERHRVDCSLPATYELWTQVDPATAGLTFDGLAASSLSDVADLPALPPAEDGTTPLRLVVPKGADAAGLDRLLRAVEAVALRGRFAHPAVEVVSAPADRPGLDIVAGTADDLKRAELADLLPEDDAPAVLRPGATPGPFDAGPVRPGAGRGRRRGGVAVGAGGRGRRAELSGTPAGLRAVALAGGRPVEGGSALTLRDLGVPSQEFSGRLFRTGFDVLLPPDFYPADYDKMTIRLDAAYAPGLDRGSQILVRVNGHDAASLPLARPRGRRLPAAPRDGAARQPAARAEPRRPGGAARRRGRQGLRRRRHGGGRHRRGRQALRPARLDGGRAARHRPHRPHAEPVRHGRRRLPLSGGRGPKAPGLLYLPHPGRRRRLGRRHAAQPRRGRGRRPGRRPPGARPRRRAEGPGPGGGGLRRPAAGRDRRRGARRRRHAGRLEPPRRPLGRRRPPARRPRARAGRAPSLNDIAAGNERDGATLFRRWSDDVSAGQWRLDPGALAAKFLQKAAGLSADNLPRWGRIEGRVAVTPDMRLAVAQHEAPGGRGDTWTLVLAPTGEALRSSVLALTAPDLWGQLDGRVATLDPRSAALGIVRAERDYFVPTAALSPGNVRLIAAGWLSTEIEVYVLGFVLLAAALGAATSAAVKRYGVKP